MGVMIMAVNDDMLMVYVLLFIPSSDKTIAELPQAWHQFVQANCPIGSYRNMHDSFMSQVQSSGR